MSAQELEAIAGLVLSVAAIAGFALYQTRDQGKK